MNNFMNDRQYFMTTSLSYQLKAAQQELASFRSGEIYVKLRADYEKIIREQNMTIQKLQKERDDFSFSRKKITQQWMEVLEDVEKEYEKEIKKLKPVLFMLNSRCNVSLEKTAQFVSDITDGALSPSVGMISGLCREFSSKSKREQDDLFKALLDAPVMHVDGTVARVNGNNKNVVFYFPIP